MGRMFETLRIAMNQRGSGAEAKPTPPANLGECVVDWTMSEEAEGPYIEVGGPNKKIEASADVLAIQPAHASPVQPPHVAMTDLKKTPDLASGLPRPMSVAFDLWPGPMAPSRGVSPDLITYHQTDHPVSQQYSLLLEQMLKGMAPGGSTALLVTGVASHVGATTVLLNLAILGATHLKRRVVVLDANLRRPSLAQRLGFTAQAGILDVLAGSEALEHILRASPIANLHVIPGRASKEDHHLTQEAAGWLIGWLRERFDLLLIDGPSLEQSPQLGLWTPFVEAVYAVAPQKDQVVHKSLAQTISRLGGRLRGLIHTHLE